MRYQQQMILKSILSDTYLEAISIEHVGELHRLGRSHFVVNEYIDLNGVALDNPTEALPTSSSDGRIYDMDGDGKWCYHWCECKY